MAVRRALVLMEGTLANPRALTPELLRTWVLVLHTAGVTAAEIEPGVGRLLQTATFFPTPADFLKALRPPEDRESGEELAWQRVLTAVRARGGIASLTAADLGDDAAALWALSRVGWERLCRELDEEHRAIWRAEFVRVYRVARQTAAALAYLPGAFETQNLRAGRDLTPALCGRPDWRALPAGAGDASSLPAGEPEESIGLVPVFAGREERNTDGEAA